VEPPGTAPGSDPLITSAFMSIVLTNTSNIGECSGLLKAFATIQAMSLILELTLLNNGLRGVLHFPARAFGEDVRYDDHANDQWKQNRLLQRGQRKDQ